MIENFKAVLWDIDGTLLDSEPMHSRCIAETGRRENILVTSSFIDSLVGVGYAGTHKQMQEKLGLSMAFDRWCSIVEGYYADHAHQILPRENVMDVVLSLASQDIRQAAVSNSPRIVVDANMKCLSKLLKGYSNPFEFSLAREDVYEGKPSPEGYLMAAARMGVKPEECVVIEDSSSGMKAGRAAGMHVVGWAQVADMDVSAAHSVVKNLSEVFDVQTGLYKSKLYNLAD